jgi:hypothetical protein
MTEIKSAGILWDKLKEEQTDFANRNQLEITLKSRQNHLKSIETTWNQF